MRIGRSIEALAAGCDGNVWHSFDQYLLEQALARGATHVPARVDEIGWQEGRPSLTVGGASVPYDLVAVALGVNSPTLKLLEKLEVGYHRPTLTKTLIREYRPASAPSAIPSAPPCTCSEFADSSSPR
jgi:hypothetical protein